MFDFIHQSRPGYHDSCFCPRRSNMDWIYPLTWNNRKKNQTKYMKKWFSRYWTWGLKDSDPQERETNQVAPIVAPSLLSGEFLGYCTGRKNPDIAGVLSELRRQRRDTEVKSLWGRAPGRRVFWWVPAESSVVIDPHTCGRRLPKALETETKRD